MLPNDYFQVLAQDTQSQARVALLRTAHGDITTPTFMPVGTYACIKALDPEEMHHINAQIIVSNAYHLYQAPGATLVHELGGLASFMRWRGATLTDSGGYQVSYMWNKRSRATENQTTEQGAESRAGVVNIDDDGVTFISHKDGKQHTFTPERSIEIQHLIGADIIMAFDQPTFDHASREDAAVSVQRSMAWAHRSKQKWLQQEAERAHPYHQMLFGIIQGGRHEDLRLESAQAMVELDVPGIAVGGETIGTDPEATAMTLSTIQACIPRNKPYYTMGLGGLPEGFFVAVDYGVDMFDNTSVTRMARTGLVFLSPACGGAKENRFRIDITNAAYREDTKPIDEGCDCPTCKAGFSRAYIHYLFKTKDALAYRLASLHNVRFIVRLGELIQQHIREGTYQSLRTQWLG